MEKEVMHQIHRILATGIDVRETLKGVHSRLRKVLGSEEMIVSLFGEENKGFHYFDCENGKNVRGWVPDVLCDKEIFWKKVFETGGPVLASEISKHESWICCKLSQIGIKSCLFYPLIYEGNIIGVLNLGSKELNYFSKAHIQFLNRIEEGLSVFLYKASHYKKIHKRLEEMAILCEMTKISSSSLNLDQMLSEMMKSLQRFFKFEALSLFLIDENSSRLLPHPSSIGMSSEEDGNLCSGSDGLIERDGPFVVSHNKKDRLKNGEKIDSEVWVPLNLGEKLVGLLVLRNKKHGVINHEDLRVMRAVGEHLSSIIENTRSEERYRAVVEKALDGVLVMGGDFRLTYANERFVDLMGHSKDELIGSDFRAYLDEKGQGFISDWLLHMQRGEDVPTYYELHLLRKSGEVRNVETSSILIKDRVGDVKIVAFLKDVTEKRKMEEQLIQAEKLRAIGEMASGVAHDFNNALAIILGNTQLLLFDIEDEEERKTLKTIESVAKKSAQTVRRLMEFSGRKAAPLAGFRVDLNTVIRDTVEITRPKWKDEGQGKGIYIEVNLNLGEILPVSGTHSEMREMVASLILNAIEAMPEGGIIDITTSLMKGIVLFKISDTGTGMVNEVKERIFEPFFTTKPFTNTGLGLSMSYGMIKKIGGEIEVESRVGEGTTFSISLPVNGVKKWDEISLEDTKGIGMAKILIIDDEEHVRDILSKILTLSKHQVVVASDGKKGIELFREGEFDIVFTDLGMPGMSGWEVCKAIKRINPSVPVGMITGWGAEVDQKKMEESRLDFIISKPFDTREVLGRIAQNMGAGY